MRPLIVLLLTTALAGCGVPDLVAHTVKAVEKSQRGEASASASSPSPASSAPTSEAEEPPPPQAAPLPRRSSVTAEELPPR